MSLEALDALRKDTSATGLQMVHPDLGQYTRAGLAQTLWQTLQNPNWATETSNLGRLQVLAQARYLGYDLPGIVAAPKNVESSLWEVSYQNVFGAPSGAVLTGDLVNYGSQQILLPHPDAANQEIGPNVGGEDGVFRPETDGAGVPGGGGSGLGSPGPLILVGGVVLLFLLFSKR